MRKRGRMFAFLRGRGIDIDAGYSKQHIKDFEQWEGRFSSDGDEGSDGSSESSAGDARGTSPGWRGFRVEFT